MSSRWRAGKLDWVVPDEAQARQAARNIERFDTVLFGRRTYEQFAAFWPRALQDDDPTTVPDPHRPGRRSREHRTVAIALNAMTKVVFSRTLRDATWSNLRIVREFEPHAIAAMKQQPGQESFSGVARSCRNSPRMAWSTSISSQSAQSFARTGGGCSAAS